MVVTEPHRSFSPAHARGDAFDRSITEAVTLESGVKHLDRRVGVSLGRGQPFGFHAATSSRDRVAAHEHVTGVAIAVITGAGSGIGAAVALTWRVTVGPSFSPGDASRRWSVRSGGAPVRSIRSSRM